MTGTTMTIGLDVTPLGAASLGAASLGADSAGSGGGPNAAHTGIGRYTAELLRALLARQATEQVIAIGNRGGSRVRGPRFPSRAAWTFGLLPLWLPYAGIDVFHGTSFYAPIGSGVPTVVTIHDLSVFTCPQYHPRGRVRRARSILPAVARRAAAVIVPSRSVADEAVRWLGISPHRVHVVPEAPADVFRQAPTPEHVAATLRRLELEPGFFLAVGTLEPRKNLGRLVEAISRLRAAGNDATLVVAGGYGWDFGPVLEFVHRLDLTERVRFLGFVPDGDLRALMAAATGLVYPSLYEGFGLPVIEAMAAGLPVVTSDSGALADLAADAALLVDPGEPDDIASAMMRLAGDHALRARLEVAGLSRAAEFSWDRTARETVEVYRAVAGRRAVAS